MLPSQVSVLTCTVFSFEEVKALWARRWIWLWLRGTSGSLFLFHKEPKCIFLFHMCWTKTTLRLGFNSFDPIPLSRFRSSQMWCVVLLACVWPSRRPLPKLSSCPMRFLRWIWARGLIPYSSTSLSSFTPRRPPIRRRRPPQRWAHSP